MVASVEARRRGKRVELPGQESRRQSAASGVGNGIPPAQIYWVLTLCLVYAVTELAAFRMAWTSVLETDWFLMKQRTAKPQHRATV